MKKLVCEMCGSVDIIKQEGLFVCQYCGTKYSLEEARKMMVEGHVDVSGSTVEIDSSKELNNLYMLARRSRDYNDNANAARYYDMIQIKDPNSWEASFYAVYCKTLCCNINQIQSAAYSFGNCIIPVINIVRYYVKDRNQIINIVAEIANRSMFVSNYLFNAETKYYTSIPLEQRIGFVPHMVNNCIAAKNIEYSLGNTIDSYFPGFLELRPLSVNAWKDGVKKHIIVAPYLNGKSGVKMEILQYVGKIQNYDPTYKTPKINLRKKTMY